MRQFRNCEVVDGYHPWTALFSDGTSLSRLGSSGTTFHEVMAKMPLLHMFTIHFPAFDVSVRLTDGFFKYGTNDWAPPPQHVTAPAYNLYYSRRCQGELTGGTVKAEVVGYMLGYKLPGGASRFMYLLPNGDFVWQGTVGRYPIQ